MVAAGANSPLLEDLFPAAASATATAPSVSQPTTATVNAISDGLSIRDRNRKIQLLSDAQLDAGEFLTSHDLKAAASRLEALGYEFPSLASFWSALAGRFKKDRKGERQGDGFFYPVGAVFDELIRLHGPQIKEPANASTCQRTKWG